MHVPELVQLFGESRAFELKIGLPGATMSGFVRPSLVGPRDEKGAITLDENVDELKYGPEMDCATAGNWRPTEKTGTL